MEQCTASRKILPNCSPSHHPGILPNGSLTHILSLSVYMLVLQQCFLYFKGRGGKEGDSFKNKDTCSTISGKWNEGRQYPGFTHSSPHSGSGLSHPLHHWQLPGESAKRGHHLWSPEKLIVLLTQSRLIQSHWGLNWFRLGLCNQLCIRQYILMLRAQTLESDGLVLIPVHFMWLWESFCFNFIIYETGTWRIK